MTVTVTPTVDMSNSPPRVQLSVTSTTETSTTITRANPDGSVVPVRTFDGNALTLSAHAGTLFDYEMPYGTSVTYSSAESPSVVSNPVTVSTASPWLVHPFIPGRSQPIVLRPGTLADETLTAKLSVLYPLGRANPLVISDGARKGAASELVIDLSDTTALAGLRALLADAAVLYLNVPAVMDLGFDNCYIQVQDVVISRRSNMVDGLRDVKLPFLVVDRPAGGSAAQRNLSTLTTFPTIAALNGGYSTLAAVQAGP